MSLCSGFDWVFKPAVNLSNFSNSALCVCFNRVFHVLMQFGQTFFVFDGRPQNNDTDSQNGIPSAVVWTVHGSFPRSSVASGALTASETEPPNFRFFFLPPAPGLQLPACAVFLFPGWHAHWQLHLLSNAEGHNEKDQCVGITFSAKNKNPRYELSNGFYRNLADIEKLKKQVLFRKHLSRGESINSISIKHNGA